MLCTVLRVPHMRRMKIPVRLVLLGLLLAEIAGFILVGKAIGVLATLGLVLFGMVAGSMLLRRQGFATLTKVQADLADGRVPARPLAEGAVLAFAALLIIVPGFLTDLAGIALLVPAVREALWRAVRRRVQFARGGASSRPAVVDLDRSEYGARRGAAGGRRIDSPWRPPQGPDA